MRRIFESNSIEERVWQLHYDGKSITQIAEIVRMPYDMVKGIILYGFRCLG